MTQKLKDIKSAISKHRLSDFEIIEVLEVRKFTITVNNQDCDGFEYSVKIQQDENIDEYSVMYYPTQNLCTAYGRK